MPRCKNCRDKFEYKFNYFEKYCWKPDCKTIEALEKLEKKKKADEKKRSKVKQKEDDWPKRKKKMDIDVNTKKYRGYLNNEIQKLSRLIDQKCGIETCIDCGSYFGKQVDGGHFHSKGSNSSLAWNLHNLHSQASHCNQNGIGGGKALGYYEGLQSRYSKEYADYVRYDIVRLYPVLKLSNMEVYEKLKIVRKIIRDIDTFNFSDPIKTRTTLNKLIGIYKNNPK
jgi:hypothetical protein